MLQFTLQVLMGFIAIMNPIGNVPIFVSLVDGLDRSAQLRVAKRSTTLAFFIVAVFTVSGNIIFRLFGITLPAFRIAGGILVFMVAYNLVNVRRSRQHYPPEGEPIEHEDPESIAVTPLATPILAGPGTISTAIAFVGDRSDLFHIGIVLGVFFGVALATYVAFVYGELLLERLGKSWINIITRLMGLILAVIAVQMIIEGIHGSVLLFSASGR